MKHPIILIFGVAGLVGAFLIATSATDPYTGQPLSPAHKAAVFVLPGLLTGYALLAK